MIIKKFEQNLIDFTKLIIHNIHRSIGGNHSLVKINWLRINVTIINNSTQAKLILHVLDEKTDKIRWEIK